MIRNSILAIALAFIYSCSSTGSNNESSVNDGAETAATSQESSASSSGIKIKQGMLSMTSPMGGTGQVNTIYFKDYGKQIAMIASGKLEMGGAAIEYSSRMLHKDGYTYNIDLTNNTGTKTKIEDGEMPMMLFVEQENFSDEQMAAGNVKNLGEETVAGKLCKVYSAEQTDEDTGMQMSVKYHVWNGMLLKTAINGVVIAEVTEINENPVFPDNVFEVPSDIEFREFNLDNMFDNFPDMQ
jgi:hypothetical protein